MTDFNAGPFVREWQKILGPLYAGKVDGDFGPLTLAASKRLFDGNERLLEFVEDVKRIIRGGDENLSPEHRDSD